MNLERIAWDRNKHSKLLPSEPINLVAPKGTVGWRRFAILHPYAYWHIVTEMTSPDAWPILRTLLCRQTGVASYTIPSFRMTEKTTQGANISAWLRFAEQNLIADAATFSHLAVTDIQNFYPSVYTHSLAWAVDGRRVIKANQHNTRDYVGNRIDKLFQSAHNNQTNGIPIGSMVSDMAAELVLTDVDERLGQVLASPAYSGEEVLVARFRDDYRILTTSYHTAYKVVQEISEALRERFDLTLSGEKTSIEPDVLSGAFRPWSRAAAKSISIQRVVNESEEISGLAMKGALIDIYELQFDYPGSQVATSQLQKINDQLEGSGVILKLRVGDLRSCVSILRMLLHLREDLAPNVITLMDKLLDGFSDSVAEGVVDEMVREESARPGNDYIEIWLYRLAMHRFPVIAGRILGSTTNRLLLMVRGTRPHVNEFPPIPKLSASDKIVLEDFSFINQSKLRKTIGKPMSAAEIKVFSSRYM